MAVTDSPARPTPDSPPEATVAGHKLDRSTIPLLVTLGLGVFAGALDLGVLSPALPALGRAFGVGPAALAWVFTLYLLANVASIPVMTKLADRNGRRPIYIACVAIFAIGSIVAISARNFHDLSRSRGPFQAAGAGGIFRSQPRRSPIASRPTPWRGAWTCRRHLGACGDHRPQSRRRAHAPTFVALDFRRNIPLVDRRHRDGAHDAADSRSRTCAGRSMRPAS